MSYKIIATSSFISLNRDMFLPDEVLRLIFQYLDYPDPDWYVMPPDEPDPTSKKPSTLLSPPPCSFNYTILDYLEDEKLKLPQQQLPVEDEQFKLSKQPLDLSQLFCLNSTNTFACVSSSLNLTKLNIGPYVPPPLNLNIESDLEKY